MLKRLGVLIAAVLLGTAVHTGSTIAEASGRRGLSITVYNASRNLSGAEWESTSPWRRLGGQFRECLRTTFSDINHDWEGSLGRRCQQDDFLVRYQGILRVPSSGTYTFSTITDDGFRLSVGSTLVIDDWEEQGPMSHPDIPGDFNSDGDVELIAGRRYTLDAWLFENGGGQTAELYYSVDASPHALVPASWYSRP